MPDMSTIEHPDWQELWYRSSDGLRLFARHYPARDRAGPAPLTVLCMPGLTRNSADFAALASHLSQRYRVIAVDQRGRGHSAYDPEPQNYQPGRYVQDMFELLANISGPVALVGTSLGGLMGMLMAATQPGRFAGLVINDIGPAVDPVGIARIRGYVGRQPAPQSWDEAIAQTRELNAEVFPDFDAGQWRAFTRNLYREHEGRPVLAYDPAIAEPFAAAPPAGGDDVLWPLFAGLQLPLLLIRGEHSDILAPGTVERMQQVQPAMVVVEVPARGHAPTLDEAPVRSAIDSFLARLAT